MSRYIFLNKFKTIKILCKLRERKNYSAEVQQHNFMLYANDLEIDKL